MEALASPLKCIIEVKLTMENGDSVRMAISDYINKTRGEEFTQELMDFVLKYDNDPNFTGVPINPKKYRRILFLLFERGLGGEPILTRLKELEAEFIEISKSELERHMSLLPFYSLLPLLFFEFPAFLILLFGPIMMDFNSSFNQ